MADSSLRPSLRVRVRRRTLISVTAPLVTMRAARISRAWTAAVSQTPCAEDHLSPHPFHLRPQREDGKCSALRDHLRIDERRCIALFFVPLGAWRGDGVEKIEPALSETD